MRANFERTLKELEDAGGKIIHVSLPSIQYAFATYYMILPARRPRTWPALTESGTERGGYRRTTPPRRFNEVMAYTRDQGFGVEAKRRIIMGTRVLRAENYDDYFGAALRMRTLVREDLGR